MNRIEVNAFWCGWRGTPGFTCTIDSTRGDKHATRSEEAGATVTANAMPFMANEPDRVKITVGKYVSIDMDEAQSLSRCSADAELPRAIVIPAQGKTCRVWLRDQ